LKGVIEERIFKFSDRVNHAPASPDISGKSPAEADAAPVQSGEYGALSLQDKERVPHFGLTAPYGFP
jgi:hypothetical protein